MKELPLTRNRGAALLVFMLIFVTMASALMIKALNRAAIAPHTVSDFKLLQQAREALIGYALAYADTHLNSPPGFLPCPDNDGDGNADAPCGSVNNTVMGRLPWKTLGLPPLKDASGSCLWYAVSGRYKENPAGALSTDTEGQFLLFDADLNSLNGAGLNEAPIAIVFAPGHTQSSQGRAMTAAAVTECGSTVAGDNVNLSANYLEVLAGINNANGSSTSGTLLGQPINPVPNTGYSAYVSAGPVAQTFNDTLTAISADDFGQVYRRMQQWVGERVRQCLSSYAANNGGRLPWPAVLDPSAAPSYADNSTQKRFGRISGNLANTAGDGLDPDWSVDPQQPGMQCFDWSWWPDFREMVFYGLDDSVDPQGGPGPVTLSIDITGAEVVILIAGRITGVQHRQTNIEKGTLSNYLESGNVIDAGVGAIPSGDENFISSDNAAAFFNDYVCTLNSCL